MISNYPVCLELITDNTIAPGMFSQIDVLSLPGAGLRHLDFPQVASMFQGYFTGDDSTSHVHMGQIPSPLSTTQCLVRTYGSEPEMYVLSPTFEKDAPYI